MVIAKQGNPSICLRCLHRQAARLTRCRNDGSSTRALSQTAVLPQQNAQAPAKDANQSESSEEANGQVEEPGGMSRRLAQMTNESIQQGGHGAKKAIEEGGFSEELKRRLESRLLDSSFKSENPAAFAQFNMPVC